MSRQITVPALAWIASMSIMSAKPPHQGVYTNVSSPSRREKEATAHAHQGDDGCLRKIELVIRGSSIQGQTTK
jgi:hypothetical protein